MTDQFCDKHFFPHLSSDNLSAFRGAFRVEEQNGYGSGGCHVETHLQPVAKSKICRSHRTRVEVIFLHYRTFAALISVVVQFFFLIVWKTKWVVPVLVTVLVMWVLCALSLIVTLVPASKFGADKVLNNNNTVDM